MSKDFGFGQGHSQVGAVLVGIEHDSLHLALEKPLSAPLPALLGQSQDDEIGMITTRGSLARKEFLLHLTNKDEHSSYMYKRTTGSQTNEGIYI